MNEGPEIVYFEQYLRNLIKKEAIGPKDTINHNIMMRKAFSTNIDTLELFAHYYEMPTSMIEHPRLALYGVAPRRGRPDKWQYQQSHFASWFFLHPGPSTRTWPWNGHFMWPE